MNLDSYVPTRRRVLASVTGLTSSLIAGCLSIGPGETDESSSPSPTEPSSNVGAAPVPSCPDGFKTTYDPWWTVVGPGPLDGVDLTLDKETYKQGERLVAKLRNISDEQQTVGIDGKIDIHYRGTDGWHTIFGVPQDQDAVFPQVGVFLEPNEGFTWKLTLSKAGLSAGAEYLPSFFHACHPIEPGQYRFVYWGVGDSQEAIGVPFRVRDGG